MAPVDESSTCGSCSLKVINSRTKAVKCSGKCGKPYHIACAKISDSDYQNFKTINDIALWFCEPCKVWLGSIKSKLVNQTKNESDEKPLCCDCFDYIKILTEEVSNLSANFKSISDNVLALGSEQNSIRSVVDSHTQAIGDILIQGSTAKVSVKSKVNIPVKNPSSNSQKSVSHISSPTEYCPRSAVDHEGSGQVEESHLSYLSKCENSKAGDSSRQPKQLNTIDLTEFPPLDDNRQFEDKGEWTYSKRQPKKNKAVPIIGSKPSLRSTKVKAAARLDWIFVSRLATDCTVDDILSYLKQSNIEGQCFDVKPRYDSYKSFKVGVDPSEASTVLTDTFWPEGTLVKEFVFKSKPKFFPSRTFLGKKHEF